jgi:hypothetical protein
MPSDCYGLFYKIAGGLLHSQPGIFNSSGSSSHQLRVLSATGSFTAPRSEQNAHHTPAPTVGRHGEALHQDSRRTHTKGRRFAPEELEREITPLLPSLQGIH